MHLVSAWADEMALVLGQVQTAEKSNEITAIPQLLATLDIAICVVTIDAMGCQKQIARNIVEKKGDYVLSLKENHQEICCEVRELFEENGIGEPGYSQVTTDGLKNGKQDREGLKGFGCVRSIRTAKGVTTIEKRYFLTSLTDTAQFAHSVRTHWGIENKLHWTLDVVFREGYARNRKDHLAANLSVLRKITLNFIHLEPTEQYRTRKLSLNRKRLYASYDPDFLLKILLNL